jgi:hypothetical protein
MNMSQLRKWIWKEIQKLERQIDKGGPFYVLEARMQAFQEILDKLGYIKGG